MLLLKVCETEYINKAFCNMNFAESVQVTDNDGTVDKAAIIVNMVSGGECVIGYYDTKERAEEIMEDILWRMTSKTDDIFEVPEK